MTTITDTSVEALRARVGATLAGCLDEHIGRLDWDASRLEQFQRDELRRLLVKAVERSRFTPGVCSGSILSGSSSSSCPSCR